MYARAANADGRSVAHANEPNEDGSFQRAQAVRGSRAFALSVRVSNGEKASAAAAAVAFPACTSLSTLRGTAWSCAGTSAQKKHERTRVRPRRYRHLTACKRG
jgi:hypothetical protein